MLKRVWKEVISGENLDAYLGIVSSVFIFFLSIFNFVSQKVVDDVLLMLISSLLIGRIADRWFFEDLQTALLNSGVTTWPEVQNEVRTALSNAQSLWVLGVAPLGFVREYWKEIIQICKRGKVHICFIDPDSPAMGIIAQLRPEQPHDADVLLKLIERLKLELGPDARNLLIKTINFIPSVIVSKVNGGRESVAFVTLNSINKVGSQRLTFVVRDNDSKLFTYYNEEVRAFWQIDKDLL